MSALILTCPSCGSTWPVEAGLQDACARQALKAALALWPPALATPLFAYLALHRPPKQALRWPKLARLLEELAELVNAGTVTRHRETRPADRDAWGAGLVEVIKLAEAGSLTLPLQGHGLLCEIVHRQASQRQAQTQRATAPLHPSHRDWRGAGSGAPAEGADAKPAAERREGQPPPAPASQAPARTQDPLDDIAARAAGLAHIAPLAKALLGRGGRLSPPHPNPSPLQPQHQPQSQHQPQPQPQPQSTPQEP